MKDHVIARTVFEAFGFQCSLFNTAVGGSGGMGDSMPAGSYNLIHVDQNTGFRLSLFPPKGASLLSARNIVTGTRPACWNRHAESG